jgi:homoserine kinase
MRIHVRAPASTANVGPGFDCVAVALDLWNELEVEDGDGEPDLDHIGVRAFAQLAPVASRRFRWIDRIPYERGLGSSASVIALGLVAAALSLGRKPDPEELLTAGVELEGHADNLAAALAGGVCVTWEGRIARIAGSVPAVPIALVPEATVSTALSRTGLPATISHGDAAFTAARATLLGAALSSGSPELFSEALQDRLHEPYRAPTAPLLREARDNLPAEALGVTLSGSGPTVIVWAREEAANECAHALGKRFPGERVVPLAVSQVGAGRADE